MAHRKRGGRSQLALTQLPKRSSLIVYEGVLHGLLATHIERLNADIETFARVQVRSARAIG